MDKNYLQRKRLGDPEICQIIMGQSPPSVTYNTKGVGIPFLQGKEDMGDWYPSPRRWCTTPKAISIPGDVLISVRAPVGFTNLADRIYAIGRGLAALRPNPQKVDSLYLLIVLRAQRPKIIQSGSGSIFVAITKKQIADLEVPIPCPDNPRCSLQVQKQIAQYYMAIDKEIEEMWTTLVRMRDCILALQATILFGMQIEGNKKHEQQSLEIRTGETRCQKG